jgi:hypothetical protein
MIKAEELSNEVVEAASKAAWETKYIGMNWLLDCSEKHKEQWRKRIRAALTAGLAAWPRMEIHTDGTEDWIELTLTQEPRT